MNSKLKLHVFDPMQKRGDNLREKLHFGTWEVWEV